MDTEIPGKLKNEYPGMPWYPSATTVQSFLRRNRIHKKVLAKKCPINDVNRDKRVRFAEVWMDDEHNIVWTDEMMVEAYPSNRRIMEYIHDDVPKDQRPVQEVMHSGKFKVMFWGFITKHGRGPIVPIFGTVDAIRYKQLLTQSLLPMFNEFEELFDGDWYLMQDNAPCHTAASVREFLAEKGVDFIEWPPYSPDLNPIENVWAWVKAKLYSDYDPARTPAELVSYVKLIWEQITPELCARFCGNYQKRLEAVIAADGGHTKY